MNHRAHAGTASKTAVSLLAAVLISLSPSTASDIEAQELSYTTVTSIEMGGAMGGMMRMVPDFDPETRQTTYMKGMMMRTDDDGRSLIMNMSDHTFTHIDHEARTYYTMSMEEMFEQAQAIREMAAEGMSREGGDPGRMPNSQMIMGPEGGFEPRVSIDRTGETMEIGGYNAERVLTIMEMVATGPEAEEMAAMAGRQVMVMDAWYSSDLPGYEAFQSLYEEMAEAYGGGGIEAIMGQAGAEAFMANPMMKDMMEQAQEEMKGLEGMPVKTVGSFVTVPAGLEFDLDAVLAAEDQPLEAGEGMSMQGAAMEAARGAMGRRLGGLMGRNRQQEEPEEAAGPTAQSITMRTVSVIEDVRTDSISDDLFQPPAGYTEARPEWMRGG